MKVTISKLQIAQAKQCVERLDDYTKMLGIIIDLLGFAKAKSQYNQLQDDFRRVHKKDIEIITHDLISMKKDAQEMAMIEAEEAAELFNERQKQLEEAK